MATAFSWGMVILSLLPFVAVLFVSFLKFRGPVLTWDLGFGNYSALLAGSASAAAAILILFTAGPLLLVHRRLRRQDGSML